jgi:hypothetical protein
MTPEEFHKLRTAGDGWAITVWADHDGQEAGWKAWGKLDALYAEGEPGWLMTIHISDVLDFIAKHPKVATKEGGT